MSIIIDGSVDSPWSATSGSVRRPVAVLPPRARLLGVLLLIVLGFIVAGPFVWMVSTSLKPDAEIYKLPPDLFPRDAQWENYIRIFSSLPMWRFLLNTLFVTATVVFLRFVVTVLCAYALARLHFPGRDLFFWGMLATLMIPAEVQLIPNFVLMHRLGWLDTYTVLIVPRVESIVLLFLTRQFFLTLPRELEEMAILDGCGHLSIIRNVVVPLSKPALALLGLFTAKALWNDFMWPLIMTNSTHVKTLQVGLSLINTQQRDTDLGLVMACNVVSVIPILLLFWFCQKHVVKGVALTGLK